jgi:predicted RNase H-like nuclease (RuvC/YqgF family)
MKLIVGIDPGTTTGVAMLDMDPFSSFCQTFSSRGASFSRLCDYISENGEPVIIACDVKKPPNLVKKTASTFNAVLSKPRKTITVAEKKKIAKSFAVFNNKHERDALVAALLAKKKFSIMFRKVDSILKTRDLTHLTDDIKELLVKKRAGNINQAIKLLNKV